MVLLEAMLAVSMTHLLMVVLAASAQGYRAKTLSDLTVLPEGNDGLVLLAHYTEVSCGRDQYTERAVLALTDALPTIDD